MTARIAAPVLGTQVRLGDGEMLEVEVGATLGTVRRCRRIDRWDQSDLNDVRSMGARRLDGLSIVEGVVNHGCGLGGSGRANCLTHNDIGVVRAVSESGPGACGSVRIGGDDGQIWLLVWIWAVEDIFRAGGRIFNWGNRRGLLLFYLDQKATTIPPDENTDSDHEEEDSDDSTGESALAYTAGGSGLLRVGYALECLTLRAGPIRTLERAGAGGEMEYLRVWTQLSFAAQVHGGGS